MGNGDVEPMLRPREAAEQSYDRLSRWYDLIAASVCGIDLSTAMVERSRRRVEDAGLGDRVALNAGDAVHLPYADGAFAAVSLSKEGGPYPMRRLYEVTRRLAPGLLDCRPIYAAQFLDENGFDPTAVRTRRVWGMPVELVLARRPG